VAERRVWSAVLRADAPTLVVRRARNTSVVPSVRAAPLPALLPSSIANRSFAHLVSAELEPLRLCSEAAVDVAWPTSTGVSVATHCHGLLPALGRLYVRHVRPGALLEAYEPIWGERWIAPEAQGRQSSGGERRAAALGPEHTRRISRVLPLSQAGYARTYEAHAAAASGGAQRMVQGSGRAGAPPAASPPTRAAAQTTTLFNHLSNPALVCTRRPNAASSAQLGGGTSTVELACTTSVAGGEFVELSLEELARAHSDGAHSGSARDGASREHWQV